MESVWESTPDMETGLGNERRRAPFAPYKGGTVSLRMKISEGTPTAKSIFEDMTKMVVTNTSAWYAADRLVTMKTDPGIAPTDVAMQAEFSQATGTMTPALVYPVGFTPLGMLVALYIALISWSRRDETEFDTKELPMGRADAKK